MHRRLSYALLVLVLVALSMTADARAQVAGRRSFTTGMGTGIGYAGALPSAELGVGAIQSLGRYQLGLFADAKMTMGTLESNEGFCPPALATCEATWAEQNRNDDFVDDHDEWLIFNAGLFRAITPELAIMAGGGAARRTRYREYFDSIEIGEPVTPNREIYVHDSRFNGWTGNLVIGALFRASNQFVFRMGHETAPGGITLGGYWILPF